MPDNVDITPPGKETPLTRGLKTTSLCSTFMMMGLSSALLGTTFVHLEKIFLVTSAEISNILVIYSVGYLVGAVICAFIYDKGVPENYFAAFTLLSCISTVVAGAVGNIYIFTVAIALQGCGFGFDDAAGQSYCVNLWLDHRLQRPILQASHAIWSFGGILGPIIIKTFLCELAHEDDTNIEPSVKPDTNSSVSNLIADRFKTDDSEKATFHENVNTSESCNKEQLEFARYAFFTVGAIIFGANIPFLIIASHRCFKINMKSSKVVYNQNDHKHIKDCNDLEIKEKLKPIETDYNVIRDGTPNYKLSNKISTIIYALLIFLFAMLNLYVENVPISFLVSFALKHLEWSVTQSSLLLSCFFAAHFTGRIIAVLTSAYIQPIKMLIANITVTAIAYTAMLLCDASSVIVWSAVVVAGLGVSNTFPTTVLWVSETIPVNGRISSILIAGASVGTISAPYLVALLTARFGEFSFVYVLMSAALLHIFVFILLYLFIFKVVRKS